MDTAASNRFRFEPAFAFAARGLSPLVAALASCWLGAQLSVISPLLIALIIGGVVANTPAARARVFSGHATLTKTLLRWGVVFLGLGLSVGQLAELGWPAVVTILGTVSVTYSGTRWAGTRIGVDRRLSTLIAAGFSICGAAAIAAVSDAVRARQRDVALAVALVTLFGSAMIVVVPWMADILALSEVQASIWAGASIHEVAQVVAAASLIGGGAVALATTIKLGRVVLLAPTFSIAAYGARMPDRRVPIVPWFVVGFAIAVSVGSVDLVPVPALDAAHHATTVLLAAGMFGLGLGLRLEDLWPVPVRALALAFVSTLTAATTSLVLIVALSM